jgi:Domain of unknown function (DUF4907)
MTFKQKATWVVVLATIALVACKRNPHEGEVFCELKPLQTATGWGYEIYVDKKLYIKQEFIPAVNGVHAFKTKEDAVATGKLVLNKLTHGKKPFVTVEELRDLKIAE